MSLNTRLRRKIENGEVHFSRLNDFILGWRDKETFPGLIINIWDKKDFIEGPGKRVIVKHLARKNPK